MNVSFRPANIRYRLTLSYVVVFGWILLLFICGATLLQYEQLRRQLYHAEVQDLETAEGLLAFDADGTLRLHEEYHNHPQTRLLLDRYMEVLNPVGEVLLRNGKLRNESLGNTPVEDEGLHGYDQRTTHLRDGTRILLISHVHSIAGRHVIIRLGYSTVPLWQRTLHFIGLLLLSVPFALVVASAAGYRMAFHVLRPLDQMASRAQTITASDLSQRLPVDNPRDEFGHMATVFNEMLHRLENAFESLRRFTADASHELRTPLASIRSVGEVGLQRSHDASEYQDIIGSMLEETNRLTETVDALLSLSRADAGQVLLKDSTFDPYELLDETIGVLGVLAEERGQRIELSRDAPTLVQADRLVLHRAFSNIVENAIKHSLDNSIIQIKVESCFSAHGKEVEISIADEGTPIPPEYREKIFERFFRVDQSRSREVGGSGLGLSIAKWAVEINGGKLSMREGAINCFVIQLTAVQAPHLNLDGIAEAPL